MKKLEDYQIIPIIPWQPVADPQVSPEGDEVLFTYSKVDSDNDRYDSKVWLYDLNDKNSRQFTFGNGQDSSPRWSPDGKMVLFISNRTISSEKKENKKMQLWVIPAKGGEAKCITNVEVGIQSPKWSWPIRR